VLTRRQATTQGAEDMDREITSNAVDIVHKDRWALADTDPNWDPTVFGPDWRNQYMLPNEEWKFDNIPEIMDGMNVFDYVDADILQKLRQLEREEEDRVENEDAEMEEEPFRLTEEEISMLQELRDKEALTRIEHRLKKGRTKPTIPQAAKTARMQVSTFEEHLQEMGIDSTKAAARVRSLSRGRKRSRSESPPRSKSRGRSKTPQEEGLRDKRQKMEVIVKAKKAQKARNKDGRKGEADRHVFDLKPKHLFSGKRGAGKTDRR